MNIKIFLRLLCASIVFLTRLVSSRSSEGGNHNFMVLMSSRKKSTLSTAGADGVLKKPPCRPSWFVIYGRKLWLFNLRAKSFLYHILVGGGGVGRVGSFSEVVRGEGGLLGRHTHLPSVACVRTRSVCELR